MKLVVDANVLFSILIKNGKSAEIFISNSFSLYVPEYVFEEIEEHILEILEKTYRTVEEFKAMLDEIKSIATIVPINSFFGCMVEAEKTCPDEYDVPYFALALYLNCGIWSNDSRLKEQNKIRVFSTEELMPIM